MDLEIESRNIEMTPRWKTEIETRMAGLKERYEDLLHGRVTLTKNRHHKKLDNVAEALVVVSLPGRHTLTARKEDKTFEEAIRTAFDAIAIEIRKHHEKRGRTEVRTSPIPPFRGVVCKLFPKKEFGFILQEGGGDPPRTQSAGASLQETDARHQRLPRRSVFRPRKWNQNGHPVVCGAATG